MTFVDRMAKEWCDSFTLPHTIASEFEAAMGRPPAGCRPSIFLALEIGFVQTSKTVAANLERRLFGDMP